jgi:hypothetical protein
MIVFNLRCGGDHEFECWFRDGESYDSQAAAGEIACPHCGDTAVTKAMMAPRLNSARGQALDAREAVGRVREMLVQIRRSVEKTCDYVGERFPEEARKIHYGEAEARGIYGEASADDAKALEEEGVEVAHLPWVPKAD